MQSIEDFVGLPDDPEEAFLIYCEEQRRISEEERGRRSDWGPERSLIDAVWVFQQVYDVQFVRLDGDSDSIGTAAIGVTYERLIRELDRTTLKFKLERARRIKVGAENILLLDEASRAKIRSLVDAIKGSLNDLDISPEKRDAMFGKLNAFVAELDRSLTRTEAFNNFVVDLFRAVGNASKEIEPIWERIDRVLDWLDKAKKWSDSLPPWNDRQQIEPPKKALPKPQDKDGDEEVPF
ncbi:hypothetical protein ACFO5Q_06160 [Kordiimonas lipolytica]|uniref:Uncharacterized protein n=1 Tax=Kordiimonas lipolytica TaxID=1662421 RepID=A0ABV8U869_9PROT|nr:hypothetical protein [Kordiimonas lipolytica]